MADWKLKRDVKAVGAAAVVAMLLQSCAAPRVVSTVTPEIAVTIVATTQPAQPPPATPTAEPTPTEAPSEAPSETPTAEPIAEPTATAASLTPALQPFVEGLEKPTSLTYAPDGNGLLYITEQPGRVRVVQNGQLLDTLFLDLTDRVSDSGNEQGLLSVAFSPDFAQSRKLYVNYTDTSGDTVVAGFIASADGLTVDPASEWVVIKIAQPYANHNGGQLKFGPDDMLYIGMGDGGSGGDPQNRAQDANDLLGKMLRIDVSQSSASQPYAVPANNPSIAPDSKPEIWALGLRNPWRFSFDRATGDMFIADVGQNAVEEVNFQAADSKGGENYGWRLREGFDDYSGEDSGGLSLTDPIWQYTHGADGCSITGGYVYRGQALPSLVGAYIYGDYCSGRIWTLRPDADGQWANELLFSTDYSITSFGEDANGELYVLDRSGTIYKLVGERIPT
jgi:glucose/arabinose dehydrogenase